MKGRRILVTGGASGIGQATCEALRQEGAVPIAADLHAEPGGVELDVRSEESWREALRAAGNLDGLVTCAGIRTRGLVTELAVEDFDNVFAVNVRGTFLGVREVASSWIAEGRKGSIVTVASVNGYLALAGQAHYAASKAAMVMFTKAAALDLSQHGIRVNAVAPGAIRTPMTAARLTEPGQEDWVRERVPLGRVGEADEVAPAIIFLLSEAARYITGTTLLVDGGWSGTTR